MKKKTFHSVQSYRINTILPFLFIGLLINYGDSRLDTVDGFENCYERTLLPLRYDYDEFPVYSGLYGYPGYLDTIYVYHDLDYKEEYLSLIKHSRNRDENRKRVAPKEIEYYANKIIIVNDVSMIDEDDYEYEYVDQELIVSTKHTNIIEVICPEEIDSKFLELVCEELSNRGYEMDCKNVEYDSNYRATLTKFQKRNHLPIGNFNLRTLKKMGIGE